ncbi:MAG: hypothetical protein WBA68_12515 [Alteraurantiacibacter sp.]
MRFSLGCAALAARAFIVTAALSMDLVAANHPQAPSFVSAKDTEFSRATVAVTTLSAVLAATLVSLTFMFG